MRTNLRGTVGSLTCDYHTSAAVEAEAVVRYGLNYRQLRCPECGRKRGLRHVRSGGTRSRLALTVKAGQVRRLTLPWSEVCMHMRVAGLVMSARHVGHRMVQLLDDGGRPFSAPITEGEAGWGRIGTDHTLTDFDTEGRWCPRGQVGGGHFLGGTA